MLSFDEIKLIDKVFKGEEVEFSDLKKKIELLVKQIEINEKASKEITAIQDEISKIGVKDEDKEEKD